MIDNTFTLISRIDGEIRHFIAEELAKDGITDIVPSHGAIILELMKHGPLPMNELAHDIDRVTMAALTEAGARLAAALCCISEKIYDLQYNGIKEDEIAVLRGALAQMYANFTGNTDRSE